MYNKSCLLSSIKQLFFILFCKKLLDGGNVVGLVFKKIYFYANSLKSFSLAAKLSKLGKHDKKQKVPIE